MKVKTTSQGALQYENLTEIGCLWPGDASSKKGGLYIVLVSKSCSPVYMLRALYKPETGQNHSQITLRPMRTFTINQGSVAEGQVSSLYNYICVILSILF